MTSLALILLAAGCGAATATALHRLVRAGGRESGRWLSVAVALSGAGLCTILTWRVGPHPVLFADCWLAAITPPLVAADLGELRLPNLLTLGSYPVALVLLAIAGGMDPSARAAVRASIGLLALLAFYLAIALLSHGGLGPGDIKAGGLLGLILGYRSLHTVLTATVLALALAGVAGATLIATRRANRHTPIPYGPAMLLGALAALMM